MQAELRVTSFPNVTAYLLIFDLYKKKAQSAEEDSITAIKKWTFNNRTPLNIEILKIFLETHLKILDIPLKFILNRLWSTQKHPKYCIMIAVGGHTNPT